MYKLTHSKSSASSGTVFILPNLSLVLPSSILSGLRPETLNIRSINSSIPSNKFNDKRLALKIVTWFWVVFAPCSPYENLCKSPPLYLM